MSSSFGFWILPFLRHLNFVIRRGEKGDNSPLKKGTGSELTGE
jgi:hypothetical protein